MFSSTGTVWVLVITFNLFYASEVTALRCLICNSHELGCEEAWPKYAHDCPLENDSCFTSVTNGTLVRGCLSQLNGNDELLLRTHCPQQEGHTCISCTENECNNVLWLKCAHCDDDVDLESCTDKERALLCPRYRSLDRCYEIAGSVEEVASKGCESTLNATGSSCQRSNHCRFVESSVSNCSLQINVQSAVSQCLRCSSREESTAGECTNGQTAMENCPQEEDACFSRLHGTTLERNCMSTLSQEEQLACGGSQGSCVSCTEPGCNTHHLLKCIQCRKSLEVECTDPGISTTVKASFCPEFLPEARCFSRLLTLDDDLERGCSSESAAICAENKHCLVCDTDGCNVESEAFLWDVAKCLRCTSADADEGVTCEEASIHPEECDQQEDDCYTRVHDGKLERNCLSTLPEEEDRQKCRDEADDTCISCNFHECNRHPWQSCYRCSSSQDPRCAKPAESDLKYEFCDRFASQGRCYAKIVDLGVERGCEADLGVDVDACAGNAMCFTCLSDGCNDVDENALRNVARCIRCSSDVDGEACENAEIEASFCDQADDVCYTRVTEGSLERGCVAALDEEEQELCRDQEDVTCITCHEPSCNDQNWLKCLVCKTSENPGCATPTEAPNEDLSLFCSKTSDQGSCYSRIAQDVLERGCSVALLNPAEACVGFEKCETCLTNNCNFHTEDSLTGGIKCVQCSSKDEDTDCNEHLEQPSPCPEKNDRCFTRVKGDELTRNCLSTLEDTDQQSCTNPSDRSCTVCDGSDCNRDHWTKCHQCDGSSSVTCGHEQPDDDALFCESYSPTDKCYIKLDHDQHLSRGCLSDASPGVDICAGADLCITCEGDSCNRAPETSLRHVKCQQCTSTDPECVLGTIVSKQCPLEDDLCFTALNNDKLLERGCLSTLDDERQNICKDESDPSCIVCSSEGCNGLRWPRCYRCRGSLSDESCDQNLVPEKLEFCPTCSEQSNCYATIENDAVIRDCTDEITSICNGNSRCITCSQEGCNDVSKEVLNAVHTCHRCRSDIVDCDQLEDHGQECPNREDRCYTRLDGELRLSRGCLSEIDASDCASDELCLVCPGKDCNNAPWGKCYQCSNATSPDCSPKQKGKELLKYCRQNTITGRCFAKIDEMEFTRGCSTDLETELTCQDPKQCVKCVGDACNRESAKSYFNPAHCLRCHSDSVIGCYEGTIAPVACANPDDDCFYRRASKKAIHRGCLSELTSTDQFLCHLPTSVACHTCPENGCNTQTWRRCYQCSSLTDQSCAARQTDSTYLSLCTKIDDYCFEDRDGAEIRRNCGKHFCDHKKTCVECKTDACNGRSAIDLLPSQCLVCESTDPLCANGSRVDHYCNYLNEPCFALVRNDGVLERGCFSNLYEPYKTKCLDLNDRSCMVCNGNSCNRFPWQQCIQCRSLEIGQYCSREASPLESHYCGRYSPNDRCYAKDIKGIVIRGCESDYDTPVDPCAAVAGKNCYTCEADHCNVKSLNSAKRVLHNGIALYVTIATVIGVLLKWN
ncbi:uncharacterized protein LOC128727989 [Anopheles nili]|uniref:uncharacterized protein LOC128727989 n=1 Tax=Anopheles nili TaxID=185578 RepID=UPI00237B0585|nr:uncharacterized protein LOC128727989 [Anopheles nili]